MRRGVLLVVFTFVAVVAIALTIAILERRAQEVSFSPAMNPQPATACSPTDVANLWDSVFNESSDGISFVANASVDGNPNPERCQALLAYKIKQNNESYVLIQVDMSSITAAIFNLVLEMIKDNPHQLQPGFPQNITNLTLGNVEHTAIFAFHGFLNESLVQEIESATPDELFAELPRLNSLLGLELVTSEGVNPNNFEDITNPAMVFYSQEMLDSNFQSRVPPIDLASAIFLHRSIFKAQANAPWQTEVFQGNAFHYAIGGYVNNYTTNTIAVFANLSLDKNVVSANYSLESYFSTREYVEATYDSCEPNWVPVNTSCSNGELTTWYNDTNNCIFTIPPANETHSCEEEQSCTPDWEPVDTECRSDDTRIRWYNDTNNCGTDEGMPQNETRYCDYNNNGLIGSAGNINDVNLDLSVYIDGNPMDSSADYSSTHKVELREGSVTRIEFEHDFSDSPLNFYQIEVVKQDSTSQLGVLGVRGIEDTKTLRVDKLINGTKYVCVKDSSSLTLTNNCTASNEKLLLCPGSLGQLTCEVEGNFFVVSGLSHSIVRESTYGMSQNTCSPKWVCTNWTECIDGTRRRVCIDMKGCGTTEGKPAEVENCTQCTPDWQCDPWLPVECPPSGNQTQRCVDANQCNPENSTRIDVRQCEYQGNRTIYILLALIAFVAAGISIIIILELLSRESEEGKRQEKPVKTPSGKEQIGVSRDPVQHSFY
ncbi:hypothetical protein D6817_04935 [Candidatus Pacearchaeota archaeon]|nr:MAG: hypothetical protein D6817_04935 [Candidatus Pacearchaeota archaeon]